MLLQYPSQPHQRKHGPSGYVDSASFKEWLRDEFSFRCVYCLVREPWYPNGAAAFAVEHVRPKSLPEYQSLIHVYENLVYACNRCNSLKQQQLLLDPNVTAFGDHLHIQPDGTIVGRSAEGEEMIEQLKLREAPMHQLRLRYLTLERLYGQEPNHPPIRLLYFHAFGYPDDLPDLTALRPPANSRPEGLVNCFYRQRQEGRLAPTW